MKFAYLTAALLWLPSAPLLAADDIELEETVITATRFKDTLGNKPVNMTVITTNDINNSSARTLPELLSNQSGINTRDLFGNNAAGATVDMRGFGASANQNTLVLLNGKRITNIDSAGVQWSSIPLASIDRIEIMRGSGAVLYGDGATGGVINIITKSSTKPGTNGQVSARTGSYGTNEIQLNANSFADNSGFDLAASHLSSDGYRNNNRNEQANAQAGLRWLLDKGEVSVKTGMDHQNIRYPGARTVQPSNGTNEVETDPRGTSTPLDYASRDGVFSGIDLTQQYSNFDLNFGLGQRSKNQKSYFYFSGYPSYRDSDLSVNSFTPSIRLPYANGSKSSLVAGVDLHNWAYSLRTSNAPSNIYQPINRVAMSQQNRALYLQNTSELTDSTTLMVGARYETISIRGTDIYDSTAPGASSGSAAPANAFEDGKSAYELGLRHQLNQEFSVIGRAGHSYRFANVDEIYESNASYNKEFQFLRPQITDSLELGVEQKFSSASWRATLFDNKVQDEIHLDPFSTGIGNTNLPPSERKGIELEGNWKTTQQLSLRAAYTYTDARFLGGVFPGGSFTQLNVDIEGKEVPLVPRHKLNLGASWAFSERTLLNASCSYVGSQYMDNDESNTFGEKIPAYTTTDLKLTHKSGAWQLNATVNNLFDSHYFSYAVSSASTPGKYNAYTLPGRTFYLGVSYQM